MIMGRMQVFTKNTNTTVLPAIGALIVWMLPHSAQMAFFIILTFTWLIAVGDFTMFRGDPGLAHALTEFFLPVLIGNIIAGTLIPLLVAWGQVRDEVKIDD